MANIFQQLFCEHSYVDYKEQKANVGVTEVEYGKRCVKCGKTTDVRREASPKVAARKKTAVKKAAKKKAVKGKTAKKKGG
jgi:hypothetical protein